MTTIIALVLQVLISLVSPTHVDVVVIPPMPHNDPINIWVVEENEDGDWFAFEMDAYKEYAEEFTALFNSYSYKLSKNGRSMVNGKFVAMGAK